MKLALTYCYLYVCISPTTLNFSQCAKCYNQINYLFDLYLKNQGTLIKCLRGWGDIHIKRAVRRTSTAFSFSIHFMLLRFENVAIKRSAKGFQKR